MSNHAKMNSKASIGLDVGGVSVKGVRLEDGQVQKTYYRRHQGNISEITRLALEELEYRDGTPIGLTGTGAEVIKETLGVEPIDDVKAQIFGVNQFVKSPRNIINLGGSSTALIRLDDSGRLSTIVTNSLCAAGTGAFLDHQVTRLGFELEDAVKFPEVEKPPSIATRCSVFAKTDLIHRQQEGHTIPELWSGLCRGMAETSLNTLLRGRSLEGETVLIGGVAKNPEIRRWLNARLGEQLKTFEMAPYAQAIGASVIALNGKVSGREETEVPGETVSDRKPKVRPRLELVHSAFPDMEMGDFSVDSRDNEIRLIDVPRDTSLEVYMGLDIGSTSTKLCVIEGGRVLFDIYRKTMGDPLGATGKLFAAVEEIQAAHNLELAFRGVGTTGSGRKFIGMVVGAERIINEITAHTKGTQHFFEGIETIFEIGGQDSKYMFLKGGNIHDANMNYVCAAGTGSFIEEVANRLGFKIWEVGKAVTGVEPPFTSERCTVFMEQDATDLLRQGYSRQEVMAAVIYSIAANYLNMVVGTRSVSGDQIFFQGATARNRGLVAAFEKILDREIVVSPHCHIMGAIGAALAAREAVEERTLSRSFRGLGVTRRKINTIQEECSICSNRCRITKIQIEGETEEPSWGYACGREPGEEGKKEDIYYQPFRERERILAKHLKGKPVEDPVATVGIPMALSSYVFLPFYVRMLQELGFRVRFSLVGDKNAVSQGNEICGGDFCLPVKVLYGEVIQLMNNPKIDYIFLPHSMRAELRKEFSNSHLCPYVQAAPSYVKSYLRVNNLPLERILSPVIDLSVREAENIKELRKELRQFGFRTAEVRSAWRAALQSFREFQRECQEKGKEILERLHASGQKGIVILGRGYNVFDRRISLQIPLQVAEYQVTVIPYDFIPFEAKNLLPDFQNLFWYNSQNIVNAVQELRKYPNIFALYIANFGCGPDSFTITYAEELMDQRPLLILELDEHGSATGYLTRIEAFLDVIKNYREEGPLPARRWKDSEEDFRKRKLWFPNMHPTANRLFEATFRKFGYEAESMPQETHEGLELGRKFTRGSECLPLAVTVGNFVKLIQEGKFDPDRSALFFAASDGPCRFGQYEFFFKIVLDRFGFNQVPFFAPSAANAYQGMSQSLRKEMGKQMLAADVLYKLRCKTKPYEQNPGQTEQVAAEVLEEGARKIESGGDYLDFIRLAVDRFKTVPKRDIRKPLVGIVGEIFVRCNSFSNDWLVEAIERYGGEAWLAPLYEWAFYVDYNNRWRSKRDLRLKDLLVAVANNLWLSRCDHEAYRVAGEVLADRHEPAIDQAVQAGMEFLPQQHTTEAMLTLGRAVLFITRNGAKMVVNASPFTCMPGTISTAIFQEVEKKYGVPVLNQFYDGEEGLNLKINTYLQNLPTA